MALFVELIEADALAARRGKQANGNGNQPEGEVALPDSGSHVRSFGDGPGAIREDTRVVGNRRRCKKSEGLVLQKARVALDESEGVFLKLELNSEVENDTAGD